MNNFCMNVELCCSCLVEMENNVEFLWIINLTLHMVSNEGLLSCLHISLIARTINVPASPNDKM